MRGIDREALYECHRDLVAINSITPGLIGAERGEVPVMEYLGEYFARLGLEVEYHEVDGERKNVVARVPGRSDRRLLLEAHMDVVSDKGMTVEPFKAVEKDGRIYGRGACDTKGSMACMLAAISAIANSDEAPPCEIMFLGMVGEENMFDGARALVEQRRLKADGAIVGEPTLCRAVTSHKGGLRYRLHVYGKAAHGATPELGVSAIRRMSKAIRRIEENILPELAQKKHELCGASTLNIGLIRGGTQVNFVPDHCAITVDRRLIPGETAAEAKAEITREMERLAEEMNDFRYEIDPYIAFEAVETPMDSEIAKVSMQAVDQREPLGVPYGTDGSYIQQLGIPCVVLGPGSIAQAHKADEYIEASELEKCAEIYLRIARNFGTS